MIFDHLDVMLNPQNVTDAPPLNEADVLRDCKGWIKTSAEQSPCECTAPAGSVLSDSNPGPWASIIRLMQSSKRFDELFPNMPFPTRNDYSAQSYLVIHWHFHAGCIFIVAPKRLSLTLLWLPHNTLLIDDFQAQSKEKNNSGDTVHHHYLSD